MRKIFKAGVRLAALLSVLGAMPAGRALAAAPVCGDVNGSSTVTSGDALLVLKKGVGQSVSLTCAADAALATCDANLSTCQTDLGASYDYLAACDADVATCQASLATCQAKPLSQPLATNQIACHDSAGNGIACAGTLHDGDEQRGVYRSFTDNGDGTITDDVTGLMWEKLDQAGGVHEVTAVLTWSNAFAKVATLNSGKFAGHEDWRLPNISELSTLVNYGFGGIAGFNDFAVNCLASCTVTSCSCLSSVPYWTSTTFNGTTTQAWTVNFLGGMTAPLGKGTTHAVRAVRVAF